MKNALEIGKGDKSLKLEVIYDDAGWFLTIEANDGDTSILFDPSSIEITALTNFFKTAEQILVD